MGAQLAAAFHESLLFQLMAASWKNEAPVAAYQAPVAARSGALSTKLFHKILTGFNSERTPSGLHQTDDASCCFKPAFTHCGKIVDCHD